MANPEAPASTLPTPPQVRRHDPIHWLRNEVDGLSDDLGTRPVRLMDWPLLRTAEWPAIEVKEKDSQFHVAFDVPGFDATDIKARWKATCW